MFALHIHIHFNSRTV